MGWRGKRDFTVLNNSVLKKHNDLMSLIRNDVKKIKMAALVVGL